MKQIFVMAHEEARRRAVQAVMAAPPGHVVTVDEPKRTKPQNVAIHAVMQEAGDKMSWTWAGLRVDIEDVKSLFMAAFRRTQGRSVRFVPGLDGEPLLLNWRTRDLKKKEASDFIDYANAWVSDHEPR